MAKFTLKEILDATGGELLQFPSGNEGLTPETFMIDGISTDTRTIEEGNLFLALIGENFDGNKYAVAAQKDGARALVLSTMEHAPEDIPVVLVSDTKIALEKIAEWYRLRMNFKVIGITGSYGKTSTREMTASALSRGCKVYATKNNNNNEIGLSLTILNAPEDTDVIVLEMGMRLRGEISELTHIAHPDVAVITNIGVAHIERLGSREEIRNAKLEILEGLRENGLLIIPYKDEMLREAVRSDMIRSDVKIAYTTQEPLPSEVEYDGVAVSGPIFIEGERICCNAKAGFSSLTDLELKIKTVGIHHIGNALVGVLCGLYFGIAPDCLEEGVSAFVQVGHRERLVNIEGVYFLDDAYNAGPESMTGAFASVRRLAGETKAYACISDMLELGDFQEDVEAGVRSISSDLPVYRFSDKDQMTEKLLNLVKDGDYVLLKASHAFEMYTILETYGSIVRRGIES